MKLEGTGFQIKVWNELNKIPSGETRTYKEIAERLNISVKAVEKRMNIALSKLRKEH